MSNLLKEAKREFDNILKYATADQLKRLKENLHYLEGDSQSKCVYGLLEGNCNSIGAKKLMKKTVENWYYTKDIAEGVKEDLEMVEYFKPFKESNSVDKNPFDFQSVYKNSDMRTYIAQSSLEVQLDLETKEDDFGNNYCEGNLTSYISNKI